MVLLTCLLYTSGNYKTRIYLGNSKISNELSESFNKLAQELENTEMLRSDFINNFSHEFKTPIVSILGFSKLLQKDTLTREQQREYLSLIHICTVPQLRYYTE